MKTKERASSYLTFMKLRLFSDYDNNRIDSSYCYTEVSYVLKMF